MHSRRSRVAVAVGFLAAASTLVLTGAGAAPQAGEDIGPQYVSAQAAESLGLPPAPDGGTWVRTQGAARDRAVDPVAGAVTTTGTLIQYTLVEAAPASVGARSATAAAAGCQMNFYRSDPYRAYHQTLGKYVPRAYSWAEVSAGCGGSYSWESVMREIQLLQSPVVDRKSASIAAGAPRKYLYLEYTGLGHCEKYRHSAFNGDSATIQVCP